MLPKKFEHWNFENEHFVRMDLSPFFGIAASRTRRRLARRPYAVAALRLDNRSGA
jgi:hypothetical protein